MTRQPTILLLAEVFPPRHGGTGRWAWELYRRLPDLHVTVAAGTAAGDTAFDRTAGLPISRMPLSFSSWSCLEARSSVEYARAFWTLNRLASRMRPDEVHCGKCLPEGLLALWLKRMRGIRFRCYVHGEELTLADTSGQLRWLTSRVLRAADGLVANSRFTQDLLVSKWGVPAANVVVMHPGVDTSRFQPAAPDPAIRERFGWTNRRVVLTVGALQKRKGQDMLIRALPAIRQRCPNVLYAIAGEGWERQYLDQLVRDHQVADLVQFRGTPADDELVRCYQQCDVFALPNRQVGWDVEGFGIVLIEAQACGRPVIAGLSGGTGDTLQPGVTGERVECGEPEPLAAAVARLLQDATAADEMGARGRRWAVEHFDWGVLARQAAGLFVQTRK